MIPWWGWLIISLAGAAALYWLIVVVFVGIIFSWIMREFWND